MISGMSFQYASRATHPAGESRAMGYGSNFLYLIAEVILHKICSGKNLIVRGPGGGQQSWTVNFFSAVFAEKLQLRTVHG